MSRNTSSAVMSATMTISYRQLKALQELCLKRHDSEDYISLCSLKSTESGLNWFSHFLGTSQSILQLLHCAIQEMQSWVLICLLFVVAVVGGAIVSGNRDAYRVNGLEKYGAKGQISTSIRHPFITT